MGLYIITREWEALFLGRDPPITTTTLFTVYYWVHFWPFRWWVGSILLPYRLTRFLLLNHYDGGVVVFRSGAAATKCKFLCRPAFFM